MAEHAVMQEEFNLHEAADNVCHDFVPAIAEDTFVRGLSDTHSFNADVTAKVLLNHLRAHCGGIHAPKTIAIQSGMLVYWPDEAGFPDYINMIEGGQKKASLAKLTISDDIMVAIAFKTMIQSGAFPTKTTELEKKPAKDRT